MRLSESLQFIPLMEADDYGSAGQDSDAVDLGLLNGLSAVFSFGALTGNSVLKVYAGTTAALAAAKGTAIAFSYRLGAADFEVTKADQLGDETAVASTGLTLTAATYDHKLLVVEIDPDTLTSGARYVVFEIDATATAMNVACVGVGAPRFPGSLPPTTV